MYGAICQRQGASCQGKTSGLDITSKVLEECGKRTTVAEKAVFSCFQAVCLHSCRRWSSLKDASNSRVPLEREMEGMQLPPRSIGSPVSDEDPDLKDLDGTGSSSPSKCHIKDLGHVIKRQQIHFFYLHCCWFRVLQVFFCAFIGALYPPG